MEPRDNEEPAEKEKKEKKKEKKQIQLERNRTAFERLQLAWIRTSLTLLAAGVGAYEYFYNRVESGKAPLLKFVTGKDIGLFLMLVSFTVLLLAVIQHLKSMSNLKKYDPDTQYSVATLLSFFLLALSSLLVIMVLLK